MARDFNQNRIANARLVSANIDKFGKTFAIESPYNADGFSSVNVTVEQAPSDIKQYLEGDNSITIYPVPSNVNKLCEYALASFPNIEDLYLFKTSAIVVLEDNLSYLLDLNKIYVPTDLLSAYQSAYPTLSSKFYIIVEDYTLTIPFVGDTTLTSEYIDNVIAMLSNAEKNAITKVVIPTDFTQESADTIAWGYNFSALVNLDNNIWYGATQYDFSVWTINGSGALTSAIVESSISSIPSGKLSAITKVIIPNTFTLNTSTSAGCLDYCDNLPNVDSLELNSNIKVQTNSDSVLYSNWQNENCKFKNVYYNYTSLPTVGYGNGAFMNSYVEYFEGNNLTSMNYSAFRYSKLRDIKTPNITYVSSAAFEGALDFGKDADILFEEVSTLATSVFTGSTGLNKLFLPNITSIGNYCFNYNRNYKLFISTNVCVLNGYLATASPEINKPKFVYFKATDVVNYMVATNWDYYNDRSVGIIDGGSTYTNIKNRGVSMNYPTLTGIDTEANIQLLTPADNSLYLASDTGNLWQYVSANSQWVNLFANYSATWYSDEDITTIVLPSAMDTSHTYYVKLTAI